MVPKRKKKTNQNETKHIFFHAIKIPILDYVLSATNFFYIFFFSVVRYSNTSVFLCWALNSQLCEFLLVGYVFSSLDQSMRGRHSIKSNHTAILIRAIKRFSNEISILDIIFFWRRQDLDCRSAPSQHNWLLNFFPLFSISGSQLLEHVALFQN